jgi:hypothetical protein
MVICIIAAVILGFLGIFSAKYRGYAREAFRCVWRMSTLRSCDTEFDKKVRAAIIGKLMRWPRFAGVIHRRFTVISWIFVAVFFISLAYTGYSVYNLIVWQNCEGPGGSCIFVNTAEVGAPNVTTCAYGDQPVAAPTYFDANASVMYFYRDGCPWCAKESIVLTALAIDGYRVKPMHLDTNPDYVKQYNIVITPTFIGPDGQRMAGYHEADALKPFLDKYR